MSTSRAPLGLATALGVVGLFVASVFLAVLFGIGTCDGDGGVPYSAVDSTAGRFCDSTAFDLWVPATALLPPAVMLVLGLVAVRVGTWYRFGGAVLAAGGVLIALLVTVVALPSSCSDTDQAAYAAWVEGGRQGAQPADCETYG